jgi:serine/threonine-protein kinase
VNVSILLSHRLLVLAVAGLFVVGSYSHGLQRIEQAVYELATRVLPAGEVSSSVVVVAIDQAALKGIGPWPWPRDRIAATVDRLRKLDVRGIGLMLPLTEPQSPPALETLQREAKKSGKRSASTLRKWAARLDTDQDLARALSSQGRVGLVALVADGSSGVIDYSHEPGLMAKGAKKYSGPDPLQTLVGAPGPEPVLVRAPLDLFVKSAAGTGAYPNRNSTYSMPLASNVGNELVPGFVSVMAALARRATPSRIRVNVGDGVQVSKKLGVPAPDLNFYPLPMGQAKGQGVPVVSVATLWQGRAGKSLRNKTVIVGLTARGVAPMVTGSGGIEAPPTLWAAHAIGSVLAQSRVEMPASFHAMQRVLIILLAVCLLVLPLRWQGRGSLALSAIAIVALLGTELAILLTRHVWLPMVLPATFLIATQALIRVRHGLDASAGKRLRELAQVRREYGVTLKAAGRLEDAFAQYRRSPRHTGLLEPLYDLGLAFESRRMWAKAAAAYRYATDIKPSYRDLRDRLSRLKKVEAGMTIKPVAGIQSSNTVILNDDGIENPMLGHYRLERELGRGAMAVVYLARDEKLGRKVAVKALSLTDEFQGEALEEAQTRFRQEAEAAARLNHPNIVTIYEAGEDHDLAYIVMDYVEGESLEYYTDPDELLTVWEVLDIGAQVAEALDYAHEKQVVHRDVKPGNIIYDRETGAVKVTDFGIACLTDSSRTRTGTVLGTPSYMSPEQAAGKKLDGRSDLFSLGVMLYQLLTGRLPFVGDSFANLIYRITTQKHPALKKARPSLNASVSRIINRALQKDPDDRFDNGDDLADALVRCQDKMRRPRELAARG